jgi:pimeloyl-ACP methyl ester carboxylesterase
MFVSVGDVRLFVDVDGASLVPDGDTMRERPILVMLHGGPGIDHTPFKQSHFSPLKDVAEVVYYDHRGNGRSDRGSPDRWTLDQWADDLFELCSVLGIEHPVVFGVSFGGFVALNYAVRHPEHPAGLVLSGTAAHIHLDRSFAMFERLGGTETRELAERFWTNPRDDDFDEYARVCFPLYAQRPQPPEVLARVTRNTEVGKHFRSSGEMRFDLRGRVDAIPCPVLVMAGVLDPMVTIEDGRELAAALPKDRTTFLEFENAGHMLPFEQPDAVVGAMVDFITSMPGRSGR